MKELEILTKFWLENLKGRNHLGDLSIDEKYQTRSAAASSAKRSFLSQSLP
jgi:hypothetical protein